MRKALQSWLLFGLLLGTTAYVVAEDLTLTTHYLPLAPRGLQRAAHRRGCPDRESLQQSLQCAALV